MPSPPEPDSVSDTSADATHSSPDSPSATRPGETAASSAHSPARHPTSLGGYRIERLLGEGGMGAVYLARDEKLDRAVALKTMRPEIAAQPGAVERFLREARTAARVAHDNIIPILHIGEDDGTPYIAMPLLEGEPLNVLLKREPVPSLGIVLKVGRETADGLAAAHSRGLVHRDIKPANIWIEGNPDAPDLVQRFRRVKILDFGLARPANDDTQLTGTGAVLGTPAYMSPEQARGHPVDFRTDLFSLGVLLYRMTTGEAPFTGDTSMAILTSLAVDHPLPPVAKNPDVPPALSALIMRLLAKDRNDRPGSAAEVAAALREIGKQVVAARKAAEAGPLPVVVAIPHPITEPVAPQYNPFTEIDATDLPPPAAEVPEATAVDSVVQEPREPAKPADAAKKSRGAGVWIAAGLAVLVATAAVVFAVGKLTGQKEKEPAPTPPEVVTGDPPKPTPTPKEPPPKPPRTDPDGKAAEWVLSVGGKVRITDAAGEREVAVPKDLPAGPFNVVRVSLAKKKIGDNELTVFRGCQTIQSLDLSGTGVTSKGLAQFDKLPVLKELILDGTAVGDEAFVRFAQFTTLHKLSLNDTKITGKGLREFKGSNYLNSFQAANCDIDDESAKPFTGLLDVDLSGTKVTDAFLSKVGKNMVWLSLNNTGITDTGLESLGSNYSLQGIYLRNTKVSAGGVAKLAKALPNCRITSDHGIIEPAAGDRAVAEWVLSSGGRVTISVGGGLKEIAAAKDLPVGQITVTQVSLNGSAEQATDEGLARLKSLAKLQKLDLTKTAITDAGLVHLKELKLLWSVDLYGTQVTNAGVAHLTALKQLRVLGLQNTKVTDDGLKPLKDLPVLEALLLEGTDVTDAGLEHLAGLSQLTQLYAPKTKITAPGVAKLAKALPKCKIDWDGGLAEPGADANRKAAEWAFTLGGRVEIKDGTGVKAVPALKDLPPGPLAVTALNLSTLGEKMTDAGLANLKGLTDLRLLNLNGTGVTDAGLGHLAGLTGLTWLDLRRTKVTAEGVRQLTKTLTKCRIMLDTGSIVPGVAGRVAAEWVLSVGGRVTLKMGGGEKEVAPGKPLPDGVLVVTKISLAGRGKEVAGDGLANLRGLSALHTLELSSTAITDAGLAHLADCDALVRLTLSGTQVTNAGLENLAGMKALADLDLTVTKINDDGLVHLKDLKALTRLSLKATTITGPGLVHLKELKELSGLWLGGTPMTDAGLEHLKGMTKLATLHMNGTRITGTGLQHLAGLSKLTELDLNGSELTNAGLVHLKNLKGLTHLNVSNTKTTDVGLAHLGGVGTLENLALAQTKVTSAGLTHLAGLDKLKVLNLNDTGMTDAGLAHLKDCKALTLLYLDDTLVTDAGLEHLKGLDKLASLFLSRTKVTPAGIEALKKALPKCVITVEPPKP